jgi:hypothetical protein
MALDTKSLAKQLKVTEQDFLEAITTIPFPVGKVLGCGNIGCTFAGAPGTVIKITANESEIDLWRQIVEIEEDGTKLTHGVPEIYGIGEIKSINAFWVCREEVEPLVLGSEMKLSARTKQYLMLPENKNLTLTEDDWSFISLFERTRNWIHITDTAWSRAEMLDEDLHKLYFLTDIESVAEQQPSIATEVWMEAYIESAMSVRGPLKGIGDVLSTILAKTGDLWITDVHLGNVGWRLSGKPTLLVYDWLTVDYLPNGVA